MPLPSLVRSAGSADIAEHQGPPMFSKNLLITSAQTVAAAVAGSVATSSGVRSDWYEQLEKPDFQPPPEVFPVAWTALYADIALTSASVLTRLEERRARRFRRALTLNLALNAGWCWAFFARRDTALGTVTAAALTVSSLDLARRAAGAGPGHGIALLPYAGWCGFATVLSGRLHELNS